MKRGQAPFPILLATRNRAKARELKRLLRDSPVRLATLDRFPKIPPVLEDGSTFLANAAKKAVVTSRHTKLPVLAEDSGLEVDALHGRPGIHSARFACPPRSAQGRRAGPGQDDAANIAKLLTLMKGIPPSRRRARFVCSVAFALRGKLIRTFQGSCTGSISFHPAGRSGFGYDPVFVPLGFSRTMAELGSKVKDSISHRSKAVAKLRAWILKRSP